MTGTVMSGLVPVIHAFLPVVAKGVDTRDSAFVRPGHDAVRH